MMTEARRRTASNRGGMAAHEDASLSPGTTSLLDLLDITADDPSIASLLSLEVTNKDDQHRPPRHRGQYLGPCHREGGPRRPSEPAVTTTKIAGCRGHTSSSDASVDTEDLLRFMEDFALGSPSHSSAATASGNLAGVGSSAIKSTQKQNSRKHSSISRDARQVESETPRLDNRTAATTAALTSHHDIVATTGPLPEETAATGIVEPQQAHLQQWARQLRTAVLSWVKAQREHQEKHQSILEKQLHDELQQQQATIDSLQAVVESQQSFLQTFLVPPSGARSHQPHSPPPRPILQSAAAADQSVPLRDAQPTKAIGGPSFPWSQPSTHGNNPRSKGIFRERLAPIPTNVAPQSRPPSVRRARPAASPAKGLECPSFRQHEILPDGTRITIYANGARKEQKPDGATVIYFANGDVQAVDLAGASYWFADTGVAKVVDHRPASADGSALYQFPNGQEERHFPDGRKFVKFPNNTTRWIVS